LLRASRAEGTGIASPTALSLLTGAVPASSGAALALLH
jgi:hypothetical protein